MGNTAGKRDEKRGRFNLFDALLIAVLLVAGFIAVRYFMSARGGEGGGIDNTTLVTYKVEVIQVPYDVKDSARKGDKVTEGVKKVDLGTITRVDVLEETRVVPIVETGEAVHAAIPMMYRVVLTIEVDATKSDSRVSIGSYNFGVGSEIFIQSKHFAGKGYCVAMDYK